MLVLGKVRIQGRIQQLEPESGSLGSSSTGYLTLYQISGNTQIYSGLSLPLTGYQLVVKPTVGTAYRIRRQGILGLPCAL